MLEAHRNAQVAGLWGNPNLDNEEGARTNFLNQLNESYLDSVDMVYGIAPAEVDLKSDPLFAAIKLPDERDVLDVSPESVMELDTEGLDTDQT